MLLGFSANRPALFPHKPSSEILSAQTRLLYASSNISLSVTLLAATLLSLLQRGRISNRVVVGWWAYMVLAALCRSTLARRFQHASPQATEIGPWFAAFAAGAGLAGIGWGGAGILLYSTTDLMNQVLLVFVIGGMMLGATSVLAARPEAFLAFLVPAGLGSVIRLALGGDRPHLAMGLLAAAFTVATVVMTGRIYRTIESSLLLQFENRDLLRDLQADIAERAKAEQALRDLSGRLLQAQDEERRRIARELHDGTSQMLAAIQLHAVVLQRVVPKDSIAGQTSLTGLLDLVDRCGSEIRTLSHLLHPPILEQAGLGPTIDAYCDGFGRRAGIAITCSLPENLPRLKSEIETALFRVTQEALANVHRHSGTHAAQIRLTAMEGTIQLEVTDQGRGIPAAVLQSPIRLGVGIRGMTERIRVLGGDLSIESSEAGTTVRARLPIAPDPSMKRPKRASDLSDA